MSKGRFIVVVLDSFGVGAMDDVSKVRPEDLGANTAKHLIQFNHRKNWPNLISLGLINALGETIDDFSFSDKAIFGTSNLKHFGADSYFGHQEIVGTDPKEPVFQQIQEFLNPLEKDLIKEGYEVERITKNSLSLIKVNNLICIGDNMETDLGQAINVVGALDYCGFDMIKNVGQIVRRHVQVARVIAFGGSNVDFKRIEDNIIVKENFIGVDAPASGVYGENYHVVHIGYGVDVEVQVPMALSKIGVETHLYGKAENIINNPLGTGYNCVDTKETFDKLIEDLGTKEGFFLANIQETDLAGHAENPKRYIDVLNIADKSIGQLIEALRDEDILIVMADHGNDPTIGHSRHTRERVPLLIYTRSNEDLINIGERDTMADVGQTVANFFGTHIVNGKSFLNKIK